MIKLVLLMFVLASGNKVYGLNESEDFSCSSLKARLYLQSIKLLSAQESFDKALEEHQKVFSEYEKCSSSSSSCSEKANKLFFLVVNMMQEKENLNLALENHSEVFDQYHLHCSSKTVEKLATEEDTTDKNNN